GSVALQRYHRLRTTDVNVKPAVLRELPAPRRLLEPGGAASLAQLARRRSAQAAAVPPDPVRAPDLERAIDSAVYRLFGLDEAALQTERRAAEQKAKSIEEVNARLQEAFKSLSVDALRTNRDEFLRVAQLSMEKFQEAARGDLDQRQKAIAELVAPVRESLD